AFRVPDVRRRLPGVLDRPRRPRGGARGRARDVPKARGQSIGIRRTGPRATGASLVLRAGERARDASVARTERPGWSGPTHRRVHGALGAVGGDVSLLPGEPWATPALPASDGASATIWPPVDPRISSVQGERRRRRGRARIRSIRVGASALQ